MNKIKLLLIATLTLIPLPGNAQNSWSLGPDGKTMVEDTYGKSDLWNQVKAEDPNIEKAISNTCDIVKWAANGAAAIGLLGVFFTMFLAARQGQGFSGKWRTSLILFIGVWILLFPKGTLGMFGLTPLLNQAGPMACLIK